MVEENTEMKDDDMDRRTKVHHKILQFDRVLVFNR
jgi:hypothetical protein